MFEIKAFSDNLAHTLDPEDVCENHDSQKGGPFSRTHADGWTIRGYISEDYFYWVNYFEAEHPVFGRVWGDFEDMVCADSKEGYEAFVQAHGPNTWDYGDI